MTENDTTFTPGPWKVNDRYPFWVDGPDGGRIVDLEPYGYPMIDAARANAHLIAAAPDLYAACQAMIRAYQDTTEDGYKARVVAIDTISAALAKARGA